MKSENAYYTAFQPEIKDMNYVHLSMNCRIN